MANSLANIPTLDAVHPGAIENAASGISKAGSGIRSAGVDVASAWGKLHGVYKAPEAGELIGAVNPIRDQTDRFGWEVGQVGAALSDYAAEIAPVKAKLTALKAAAGLMLMDQAATDGGESHWRRKQSNVDAENKLLHEVAVAVNEAHQIAAKCANRINGLTGGTQFHGGAVPTGSPDAYWSNDPSHLSWAAPVQKDNPWWKDGLNGAVGFGKGVVVDGAWGMVKGVGTMAGFGPKGWDWHNAWNSYKAIETLGLPLMVPGAIALPSVRKAEIGFGKDFVAWDEWKKDKGRAAGKVGFNVLTLGIPETRLGMAGKAGDAALAITKGANKVDVVGRGFSLGLRAGSKGLTAGIDAVKNLHVGEGLSQLKGIHVNGLDGLHAPAPKVDPGHFDLKDPKVSTPHESPGVHESPLAKPTVRQVADHVENKYPRDTQHPGRSEHEPTTVGGKQQDRAADVHAHDNAGGGNRTLPRPSHGTDPSSPRDPATAGGGRHGDSGHAPAHDPAAHDPAAHDPAHDPGHDPGQAHDAGQGGHGGHDSDAATDPHVHDTHIPGMVEDHGTFRFKTNSAGEAYGDAELGDTFDHVISDAERHAVFEYTRQSWPYNPILRAEEMGFNPQALLDHLLGIPGPRAALIKTFDGKVPTLADIYHRADLVHKATSHPLPHSVETQRGLQDIDFMKGYDGHDPASVIGKTQSDNAIMSTALGEKPPPIDGQEPVYRLHLDLPKGQDGMWLGHRSKYPDQRELLLPKGTHYTVTRVSMGSDGKWDLWADVHP